ncbi:NAD-dependent epimerase/dehydratase family protein [Arcicella sp. DC2W]|uniref:NAD-dependent epimerase/dehydratase family protein n=1 Tax=Arcicella gelida TaxID=2984195 RepID=A0ABU5SBE3_9BACT|nr:NAD-dependent epimerase/dehydratase family protein [Arcicella sp. DC2W]MEA5405766.1 NAD-dependent epimerase/dehydratase family protein [Arcicella sp. DC2W]
MKSEILVLGSTGSIGYAFTENLLSKNIPVTIIVRDAVKAKNLFQSFNHVEIIKGDAQDLNLLKQVAADKKYIFHGINYPYNEWFGNMDVVTNKIIEAASLNKAMIVFPGNVYNYGNTPLIKEDSPENPCTRKGALRVEIEKTLRDAANAGKCKVLNVCLPDFWGPNVLNYGIKPIFINALKGEALPYMVRQDIPHQLVFTKDAAEIMVRLMQRGIQKPYENYNYGGQVHPTMKGLLNRISRLANAPEKVKLHPKWLFSVLGIFMPMMKEVKEMLYLFEGTVLLDDTKVRSIFPDFKETPLDEAITETLNWFRENQL